MNSRCYSCNLILNDAPFRWRGRYNEDTILSLDMLHKRCCTILFYEWCMSKARTRTMKGGNTDSIYVTGTGSKSRCWHASTRSTSRSCSATGAFTTT